MALYAFAKSPIDIKVNIHVNTIFQMTHSTFKSGAIIYQITNGMIPKMTQGVRQSTINLYLETLS